MRNFRSSPRYQDGAYFVTEGCGLQGNEQTNLGPINIRGMRWNLRPPYPYEAAARALAPPILAPGFRITKTGNSVNGVDPRALLDRHDFYDNLLQQLEQDRMAGVIAWPDYVARKNLYEARLARLNGIGILAGLGDLGAAKKKAKKKKPVKKLTAAQAKKLKAAEAKKLKAVQAEAAKVAAAIAVPPDEPAAVALPIESNVVEYDGEASDVVEYEGEVPASTETKMTLATAAAVGLGSILLLFRRH